ncbi:hypothetical protein AKJ16_DCAP23325 [Drosera capensis]
MPFIWSIIPQRFQSSATAIQSIGYARFLSLSVIFFLRAQSSSFDSLLRRLHRVPGDGESSQDLLQIIAAIISRVSHSA